MAEEEVDLDEQTDESLETLNTQARNDLALGRKQLSDLIEKGTSQPDERIIALRAKNQHNQFLVDETTRIQKEREQQKLGQQQAVQQQQ
jgi:hypothetical protein